MDILSIILNSTENDYIDFKQKWYTKEQAKFEMVHDIICLANSITDNIERFIVIGIKEDSKTKEKTFFDVSEDSNIKTSEDIITILRNYVSVPPKIEVLRRKHCNKSIDIIQIAPVSRDLPYVLFKDCKSSNNNTIIKANNIYSRSGSQNTPKNEQCSISIIEELFARKRGENLAILDRFKMYLEDVSNWNKVNNTLYYNKNHKYKIININNNKNYKSVKEIKSYLELVRDTYLGRSYFNNFALSYDDYYSWFDVELWADNTIIKTETIFEIYSKYFFIDNNYSNDKYYVPCIQRLCYDTDNLNSKEKIIKSYAWNICKLLFKNSLSPCKEYSDSKAEEILDLLNYEYMDSPSKYIEANKNWIYDDPNT